MLLRNDAHMRKRDRDLRRWQGSRVDMCAPPVTRPSRNVLQRPGQPPIFYSEGGLLVIIPEHPKDWEDEEPLRFLFGQLEVLSEIDVLWVHRFRIALLSLSVSSAAPPV